jgi:hypothetical protein
MMSVQGGEVVVWDEAESKLIAFLAWIVLIGLCASDTFYT